MIARAGRDVRDADERCGECSSPVSAPRAIRLLGDDPPLVLCGRCAVLAAFRGCRWLWVNPALGAEQRRLDLPHRGRLSPLPPELEAITAYRKRDN
jgi:hypothetical protein